MRKGACIPLRVHTVVVSIQHSDDVSSEQINKDLMEKVVKVVIPEKYLDAKTIFHIQPSGRFVIGGPQVCWYLIKYSDLNQDPCLHFVSTLIHQKGHCKNVVPSSSIELFLWLGFSERCASIEFIFQRPDRY